VLSDFLLAGAAPAEPAEGPAERAPADGSYPPAAARLALVAEVLRVAGEPAEAAGAPPNAVGAAAPEAAVARALVRGPYPAFGGRRLDGVLRPPRQGGSAPGELLAGWDPATRDIRTLLADAALAFAADPERYAASEVQRRVLERARLIQQPGVRFRGGGETADLDAIAARDTAAAQGLFDLLTGTRTVRLPDDAGAATAGVRDG
jgi:hypothetical protein